MTVTAPPDLTEEPASSQRGLNEFHSSAAYHCGRLVAAMQHIQDLADNRVGSTFVSRYYSSAAQSPATIIPRIWAIARQRLRQIPTRKMLSDMESLITGIHNEIVDKIPIYLTLSQQAIFQLGFFHQKAVVPRFDARKRYLTIDGTAVRSDGERFIYNLLRQAKIDFEYERPLAVPEEIDQAATTNIHPDFTVLSGNHALYIEYLGVSRDPDYKRQWRWKQKRYIDGIGGKSIEEVELTGQVSMHTLMEIRPEDLYSRRNAKVRLATSITAWLSAVAPRVSPF